MVRGDGVAARVHGNADGNNAQGINPERLSPNPDLVWQRLKGEAFVINLRTNKIYVLSSTAARFWELLDEDKGLDEIAGRLQSEFDIEPGELDQQIQALLGSLVAEDLVSDDPRP